MTVLEEDREDLSRTFAALADPTRRAIVARLTRGEASVNELTTHFELSQQAISKHVKVLERAGLVSRGRSAQARPCRLEPERLDGAAAWISEHRRMWADRYDRLDAHLEHLARDDADRPTRPTGPPMRPNEPPTGEHTP